MQLKVLTYNMHKGFCFYSRQYVVQELREAIRSVDADLVFLQEVMGVHPTDKMSSSDLTSQFEYLADQIWNHYAYGKNAVYSSGHHGNAILSKYPFRRYENINISTNTLERRGLLHAEIEVPGTSMIAHVVCLHLDLLERGRRQQLDRLVNRVKNSIAEDEALIVAGDFNDWKKQLSDPLETDLGLKEAGVSFTGQHARTFPSWKPFLSLDRIYVRRCEILNFQVLSGRPWSRMSDHAAVLAELKLC